VKRPSFGWKQAITVSDFALADEEGGPDSTRVKQRATVKQKILGATGCFHMAITTILRGIGCHCEA
jgi:hypothetical protein